MKSTALQFVRTALKNLVFDYISAQFRKSCVQRSLAKGYLHQQTIIHYLYT